MGHFELKMIAVLSKKELERRGESVTFIRYWKTKLSRGNITELEKVISIAKEELQKQCLLSKYKKFTFLCDYTREELYKLIDDLTDENRLLITRNSK